MNNDFLIAYRQNISSCLANDFKDNWDDYRFGPEKKEEKVNNNVQAPKGVQYEVKQLVKKLLSIVGLYQLKSPEERLLGNNVEHFQWIYQRLVDDESRQLLVQIISFHALGYRHVKLPLNNPQYWKAVEDAEKLGQNRELVDFGSMGRKACNVDLSRLGYSINLFFPPFAVTTVFVFHQYECRLADQVIKADAGDVVIDAGGCYGDTALYFAHEVGETGKVYSFEFMPDSLVIFEKNMALNPELSRRINLVRMPLWSKSAEPLFVEGSGPGTRVVPKASRPDATRVETLTIDDLASSEKLDRVDFIKMDIEGAELEALRGAENTIRRFRPKLAISVYHNFNDYWEIPLYIDSLGLGYKFSLRHFTIHAEESVLFAY
jgi:FkbM family methyltransferase